MAFVESLYRFACPTGLTTKNEQCSLVARMEIFQSKSKEREEGRFFARMGIYLASRELFSQGEAIFLQQVAKN